MKSLSMKLGLRSLGAMMALALTACGAAHDANPPRHPAVEGDAEASFETRRGVAHDDIACKRVACAEAD